MNNEFEGDSAEYELLTEGVRLSKDVMGMCLEIGLRRGKGIATIIDAMSEYCPGKIAISVDPYGNLPYEGREGNVMVLDYTEKMRNECLSKMYPYARSKNIHWKFIELTDKDFFDKFGTGVIVYAGGRYVQGFYSFVHLDGPHNITELKAEFEFFIRRMPTGAILCYDDITPDFFDIKEVERFMGDKVQLVKIGQKKALYRVL